MVVTIDGLSATGKSSLAREISKRMGYKYLDMGILFRTVTLALLNKEELNIDFKEDGSVFLNGRDVSSRIRDRDIGKAVVKVGGDKEYREFVYNYQRAEKNLVVSGRDSGSRIFPKADVKFFVYASMDKRVSRRAKDNNENIDLVRGDLEERDKKDMYYGNLLIPKGAIEIDNSSDDFSGTVEKMISFIKNKGSE